MTETCRDYFPQPKVEPTLVLVAAHLLMRAAADARTMADYIAEACANVPAIIRCAYCGFEVERTPAELADLPYPEVGPCCSDMCSITRRHNTPEFGGVA